MNILLSHCHYRSSAPSGEDAVYRNERALLEEHGHTITPFELFNDDIDDSTFASKISVARATVWSQSSYDAVAKLIRLSKPDVAHFHNTFPQMSPSVYAACQDHGVPVVQSLHNYRFVCANGLLLREGKPCEDCLTGGVFNALRHRCYRNSLPATTALVWMQVSNRRNGIYENQLNRYIVSAQFPIPRLIQGGLPKHRLMIKPNFLPNPPTYSGAREHYAVFVGRLTAEKGVHTLINAWKHLPGIPLKILGDGALRAELEQIVREHQLKVEFLGYQSRDQVLSIVAKAALQIIPSECYEGFPMAMLEAYASGTPVLASRIGSLDELVEEGKTGRKFAAGDAQDLARIARHMLDDPAQLRQMGGSARETFDQKYSAERNYEILMDVYREAINDFAQSQLKEKRA
jgi:glycosyltransferase involved in cell wall biosynthesis